MANQITWQDKIQFGVGDTIKVSLAVKEGEKTRIQIFQGIVIAIRGKGTGKNIIVRKIATGSVGVEKILPINTPTITGIEIVKKGKVRRAKLYFLRTLLGKKATKVKDVFVKKGQKAEIEVPVEATIETPESGETKAEKTRPEPIKVKNAPKVEVVKVKKIKKGPKKIVRKEKIFVR
ncbi:MAG: 50S ribosomal protein L19 [Candidatus Collierbacteria bacterium GW2011_GWB1_45_35]|uniref:50S ribosomal protein L19 n=2 Tax=Candidatus Collieribacteriota TaxID=1752725 RepID=A0A0G1MZH4_9BACT|nr:MAG: 50S ribosomal protein L19 [Microgenomates group bacterium GW2011_GWC1_44_23]KKT86187.1 MAG: 50S ribosomal protein L19 [Candidatus Collierbacteria bacterium GW2011_GWA2_44_99]KKT95689.1 MAG: 50S ribosomal protein L19 [Candidatus Collierbacteria bacterium GW2011_GWA1_45_15]KKU00336.1 MAG: 50S ribosomal protein L19 [Candidatus Collierbacteria bacterium GW2011_GWB2_45_17]KKU05787.1 MAG: 50S ribosomal protein L19 [Candidatus Collierbacteria bacterium GW2011_GWB1_45_35]KKU08335.1 MAG: 50S ri